MTSNTVARNLDLRGAAGEGSKEVRKLLLEVEGKGLLVREWQKVKPS